VRRGPVRCHRRCYPPRVVLAVRVGAAVSALFWAVFFYGLIDLAVLADPRDFLLVVALEAGWGVLFTFFVAGPLVVVALRPQAAVAAAVQLFLVTVALLVSCLLGLDARPLPVALALGATAVLLLLASGTDVRSAFGLAPDRPLVALAIAAAPFWLLYAVHAFSASRGGASADSDITWGIDHWPVHGAAALTIVLSSAAASLWAGGRRLLGATTCLAGTILGVASLAYPDSSGAMAHGGWALAAILWSVAVGLLSKSAAL
jgi:hypothetical protein